MITFFISVTSHALYPLPLSQTVTPSRTPSPLERDVLYGRPLYRGTEGTVVPGRRAKGAQNRRPGKVFLKLFRNNSQRLSLARLGYRHSINQSNRLQLTAISFLVMYCMHSFRIFM